MHHENQGAVMHPNALCILEAYARVRGKNDVNVVCAVVRVGCTVLFITSRGLRLRPKSHSLLSRYLF